MGASCDSQPMTDQFDDAKETRQPILDREVVLVKNNRHVFREARKSFDNNEF